MPVCQGERIPLDVSIGGTPIARLALDGRTVHFLLDTGATYSAVDAHAFGVPSGTGVTLRFSLPNSISGTFITEDMSAFRAPAGGQQGRIGTDLLSHERIEFHYEVSPPFAVIGTASCDSATLLVAGLVDIGLSGYHADISMQLHPRNATPNVPVIGMRIGAVTFPAQVDTGFDAEFQSGVIQVNAGLIAALRRGGISMHPVAGPPTLGCDRRRINQYWQVEGASLAMVTSDGEPVRVYPPPILEVKADPVCGGIVTFDVPFGQLGASWLSRWGTTVFDGPAGHVWVRR